MPETLEPPTLDATPASETAGIKEMADKFRANWTGTKPEAPAAAAPAAPAAAPKPDEKPAAAAAPAAKPEAKEEPDEPAPNHPLTREDFKRLSQSKKEIKAQAEKLRLDHEAAAARAKQLEEELTKTRAGLPSNLDEIKIALEDSKRVSEENKKLTETLETLNLERSPRFQNWWTTETGKHIKVAQSHVPAAKREEFAKLLMADPSPERDAALDDILEPLSSTAKRLATGALEQLESLRIQREEALAKGSERYKELIAHEQAETQKQAEAKRTHQTLMTEKALAHSKNFSAFKPTGDAAKDAEIPAREAFVKACLSGKLDDDTMLNIPAAAVEYLHQRDTVIPGLKAEIAKQAELIKQLQGTSPRAGEGRGPSGGGKAPAGADDRDAFAAHVMALRQK